ncbi:MAG: hypothetical protein K2X74_12460, partial [Acetobacteraceae bacterium]|nr:hypothetical protein [Acetobacteraceae bacterium]
GGRTRLVGQLPMLLVALAQPVLLVVLVPRRWLRRAMLIWLALPVVGLVGFLALEVASRPGPANTVENLVFAAALIGSTFGLAWVVGSGLAFAFGLWLRRRLRPEEPEPVRAAWPPGRVPPPIATSGSDPRPHPLAAWRTALLILIGAVVAIAAGAALTPERPRPALDKLPSFTPPSIGR